jgi:hypothetical protein
MVIEYLTAILVFITAIYAYLTHRMAKSAEESVDAMNQQTMALSRPYVAIQPFIRPHTPILYLRIKNSGRTAAMNLELSIDRDFYQFGETNQNGKNLKNLSAFTVPIDSFPPEMELLFALGQGWVLFGEDGNTTAMPTQFAVTAKYAFSGIEVSETTHIDLRPYLGSEGERDPLVEEVEKVRKVLEKNA